VPRQRVGLAAEVKVVLDSRVRFEQQEKENEQARLVKSVVDNVMKNISEEKTEEKTQRGMSLLGLCPSRARVLHPSHPSKIFLVVDN
jgi:Mitochondrial ATP synthase B chain precursor (ATP-synt_B)